MRLLYVSGPRRNRPRDRCRPTAGIRLEFTEEPPHEREWAPEETGVEVLAAALARHCRDAVLLLHDRRVPMTRLSIDHLAVTGGGVWVIGARNDRGKVAIDKPMFGEPRLHIAGEDRTQLVRDVLRQAEHVHDVLAPTHPDVLVRAAIGYLGDGLPLWPRLSLWSVPIVRPRALARLLNRSGPLEYTRVVAIAARLAGHFPTA